ncbi:MAG: SDR family NAD(P)-dependent oxidoreductase [Bryobacteraceae bacterium]
MFANEFYGKTVVVTGASRGLGLHIAEAFWNRGADLFLVARSADALASLGERFGGGARKGQRVRHLPADLAEPSAANAIFEALERFSGRLDVLVNNAAIVGPIGPVEENDWPLWQRAIQVNLLAPVALCRLAIGRMKAQGGGVIVNLSGGSATSPRPFFSAYAAAKAGLARFSETAAAEAARHGIRVNSIAPGAMNTEMHDAVLRAGPEMAGETEYRKALEQAERGGSSPLTPSELAVFLASDAAAHISGKLISAVWDPWTDLASRAAELARSDIYTLRRIVPEDRGLQWT